jgi:hypothetical protein
VFLMSEVPPYTREYVRETLHTHRSVVCTEHGVSRERALSRVLQAFGGASVTAFPLAAVKGLVSWCLYLTLSLLAEWSVNAVLSVRTESWTGPPRAGEEGRRSHLCRHST